MRCTSLVRSSLLYSQLSYSTQHWYAKPIASRSQWVRVKIRASIVIIRQRRARLHLLALLNSHHKLPISTRKACICTHHPHRNSTRRGYLSRAERASMRIWTTSTLSIVRPGDYSQLEASRSAIASLQSRPTHWSWSSLLTSLMRSSQTRRFSSTGCWHFSGRCSGASNFACEVASISAKISC